MKQSRVAFYNFDYQEGSILDCITVNPKDCKVWVDTYYKVCGCEQ